MIHNAYSISIVDYWPTFITQAAMSRFCIVNLTPAISILFKEYVPKKVVLNFTNLRQSFQHLTCQGWLCFDGSMCTRMVVMVECLTTNFWALRPIDDL